MRNILTTLIGMILAFSVGTTLGNVPVSDSSKRLSADRSCPLTDQLQDPEGIEGDSKNMETEGVDKKEKRPNRYHGRVKSY